MFFWIAFLIFSWVWSLFSIFSWVKVILWSFLREVIRMFCGEIGSWLVFRSFSILLERVRDMFGILFFWMSVLIWLSFLLRRVPCLLNILLWLILINFLGIAERTVVLKIFWNEVQRFCVLVLVVGVIDVSCWERFMLIFSHVLLLTLWCSYFMIVDFLFQVFLLCR